VLIVGAGPVGLTLAIDLAQRGIQVTVVETRAPAEPPSVKCNHVAARTMEIFRRLGLAGAVRNAGLPANYPNDVAFRTSATGIELSRIPIPCRAERYTAHGGPDTWWPTSEPPHRINQIYLEPVMFSFASATPRLSILNRTRVVDFVQNETGVIATAQDLNTGESREICADYLVGCDGAHSDIRHKLDVTMYGDPVVINTQSTFIRAPTLLSLMPGPAWCISTLSPRCTAFVFAIDGHERWLIHNFLRPGEDSAGVDRNRRVREILGVRSSFEFEILGKEDWTGRRMIANRFRDRRVFLWGDAAHIWVPFGGYGMNAGIADAMNLSWMLAGAIQGWAAPAILDAYEIERQPITEQVSRYAMGTAQALAPFHESIPEGLEQTGRNGDTLRTRIGQEAYHLNVGQFCCGGLNFGYFYENSPIIAYDAEKPPAYTIYDFSQSTVPGCRTPHLWLRDGRSLYDALGPYFTVLRFDPAVDVQSLVVAAERASLPLSVLDVAADEAPSLYPQRLVLSRPDQHVAWRGDNLPPDPMALVDCIRAYHPLGTSTRVPPESSIKS
jgi:2-polyprenyl-6-methoxyphenol hydroxylase-like FAD-dependent oxidoreductase